MRRINKRSLIILPLVLVLGVATACSTGSANGTGSGSGGAEASAAEPSAPETSNVSQEAGTSRVKMRPDPKRAKFDRGEMDRDKCLIGDNAGSVKVCVYGDRDSDVTVALFGDSHALQYGPPLIRLANQRGWKLLTFMRGYCTVAQVRYERPCDRWRGRAIQRMRNAKPDLVVVSASTGNRFQVTQNGRKLNRRASEPLLRTGMARTMRQLKNFRTESGARSRVILIRDQALAPFRPPDCLHVNRRNPKKCGFRAVRPLATSYDFVGTRRVKGIQIIDPLPVFCPKRWCRPLHGDIIIHRDKYHISATYARTLTGWLGRRIGNVG